MGAADIPFRRDMAFEYGAPQEVAPSVRRIVARNPSAFTFHGTNSYVVGRGEVAVIDPGPADAKHVDALLRAVAGETVSRILVTHTHLDHSPAAKLLKQATGAPVAGAKPKPQPDGAAPVEAAEPGFAPDVGLRDGDRIAGDGWCLEAVFTPGHMSNHHCFRLVGSGALFSGDHVMGWNTTIVSPPDGDMGDYLRSLRRCIEGDDALYLPGHGPPVADPGPFLRAYLDHRLARESEILRRLEAGARTIPELVAQMYDHLAPGMHGAAARSVLAHLEHMAETGRVASDGKPGEDAAWRPV